MVDASGFSSISFDSSIFSMSNRVKSVLRNQKTQSGNHVIPFKVTDVSKGANTPPREVEKKPRICMPTFRGFTRKTFQCGLYEAQDVLSELDDIDLIYLQPGRTFGLFGGNWHRRLIYKDFSKTFASLNPGMQRFRINRYYDLFIAVCQNFWDILYLNAIDGWKERCKTSVLWIDELWASTIPLYHYWLDSLRGFDHVIVGCSGTVEPLSRAIKRSCFWLPGGVDALRFSPFPWRPARTVDVYSIGRRWPGIHRELLKMAESRDMFYLYDTLPAANSTPYSCKEHRELFANVAKRSRYFMVAPGKMDDYAETDGQVEVGYRYYEGSASGTIMIGQAPDCEAFRALFPWPNAVIPVRPDGSDIARVLGEIDSDPACMAAMSKRNAVEALLRHDWVYRWKEVFRIAGISPSERMVARECRLKDLAASAIAGS